MKKTFRKKLLSWVLSCAMIMGMTGGMPVMVKAAGNVQTGEATVEVLTKVAANLSATSFAVGTKLYIGTDSRDYSGQLPTAISADVVTLAARGVASGDCLKYVKNPLGGNSNYATAVHVNNKADGFDYCQNGAVYVNTSNSWAYSCDGGGVQDLTIQLYTVSKVDATVTVTLKDNVSYTYDGTTQKTVSKDDIQSVTLTYDYNGSQTTSTITDFTLSDDKVGNISNGVLDNKVTISYGLGSTVQIEVPMYPIIASGASTASAAKKETTYGADQKDVALDDEDVITSAAQTANGDRSQFWDDYAGTPSYSVAYTPKNDFDAYTTGTPTTIANNIGQGEIAEKITNAGTYTVTATVPYDVNGTKSNRTYTYTITVDKADLAVKDPIDYVDNAVEVKSHTTRVKLEGKDSDVVLGEYKYPDQHDDSKKVANADTPDLQGLTWNFALSNDKDINNYEPKPITGNEGRIIYRAKELDTALRAGGMNNTVKYGDALSVPVTIDDKNYGTAKGNETWTYKILDEDGNQVGETKTVTESNQADGMTTFEITGLDVGKYSVEINFHGGYTTTDEESITVKGTVTKEFEVQKRSVTFIPQENINKVYDSTDLAYVLDGDDFKNPTFTGSDTTLQNFVAGDNVTITTEGKYADATVGTDKTINWSNITLSGEDAHNYELTSNTGTSTGSITKAKMDVSYTDLGYMLLKINETNPDFKTGANVKTTATLLQKVDADKELTLDNIAFKTVEVECTATYTLVENSLIPGAPTGLVIGSDGTITSASQESTNDNISEKDSLWPRVQVTLTGYDTNYELKTAESDVKQIPYAVLGKEEYPIHFNNTSGADFPDEWTADIYESKDGVTLPELTKPGYDFEGWYEAEDFNGDAVTQYPAGTTGTKNLYAKWGVVTNDLTYQLNGGTNNKDNVPTFTVEDADIALKAPTKPGYTFGGWYTTKDFEDGSEIETISAGTTEPITIYAKWNLVTNKVTYNLNGGTNNGGNTADFTVEDADIELKAPTKDGYTFGGWYTTKDFKEGTKVDKIAAGTPEALELYAKWEKKEASKVTISKSSMTMKAGETKKLAAKVEPSDLLDKGVTWKSSKKSVAIVSADGVVIGLKAGTVTITATSKDGKQVAVCKVKVIKPFLIATGTRAAKKTVQVTWTKVTGASGYEVRGGKCNTVGKKLKTTKGTSYKVTKINGKKLKKDNVYKFTVKAYKMVNGKKIYLATAPTVHVRMSDTDEYANAKTVSATKKLTLKAKASAKIKAKAVMKKGKKQTPNHGAYIRYVSSDTSIATVNAKGKVTAKAKGKCTIYVLPINGKYQKVTVTVK